MPARYFSRPAYCEADKSFLRVIKTTFMLGGEECPNPVVICSDCGVIMVRIGGIVGEFGWALHKPTGIPKMESEAGWKRLKEEQ